MSAPGTTREDVTQDTMLAFAAHLEGILSREALPETGGQQFSVDYHDISFARDLAQCLADAVSTALNDTLDATPGQVAVTQADRDAAVSTIYDDGSHSAFMMNRGIIDGGLDEYPLVQAFARHRLAHSDAASPALYNALETLANAADKRAAWGIDNVAAMRDEQLARSEARAALALARGEAK